MSTENYVPEEQAEIGTMDLLKRKSCCSLAMAYVPVQSWEEPYEVANALQRGTIFPALDMPFLGRRIMP